MAADLEEGQRGSGQDDLAAGVTQPALEAGDGAAHHGKGPGDERQQDAPGGDEAELDDGQRDGLGKRIEDTLGRGVGESARQIPLWLYREKRKKVKKKGKRKSPMKKKSRLERKSQINQNQFSSRGIKG